MYDDISFLVVMTVKCGNSVSWCMTATGYGWMICKCVVIRGGCIFYGNRLCVCVCVCVYVCEILFQLQGYTHINTKPSV